MRAPDHGDAVRGLRGSRGGPQDARTRGGEGRVDRLPRRRGEGHVTARRVSAPGHSVTGSDGTSNEGAVMVDYRIELVMVPVADVDRSRAFYGDTLGWPVDHDVRVDEHLRFVQVTPPGSACSIAFGEGISEMAPGSLRALQVVVASADDAYADLVARGVDATPVQDLDWGRFTYFADPDGNSWAVQELPRRG